MTVQLLHPEFPYIWGKFYFLFYQCTDKKDICRNKTSAYSTWREETSKNWNSNVGTRTERLSLCLKRFPSFPYLRGRGLIYEYFFLWKLVFPLRVNKKSFCLPIEKVKKYFLRNENSSYLWERSQERFLVSYLWERIQYTFLFPTCVKAVGKYFCFLPVGKNSGNISVS